MPYVMNVEEITFFTSNVTHNHVKAIKQFCSSLIASEKIEINVLAMSFSYVGPFFEVVCYVFRKEVGGSFSGGSKQGVAFAHLIYSGSYKFDKSALNSTFYIMRIALMAIKLYQLGVHISFQALLLKLTSYRVQK